MRHYRFLKYRGIYELSLCYVSPLILLDVSMLHCVAFHHVIIAVYYVGNDYYVHSSDQLELFVSMFVSQVNVKCIDGSLSILYYFFY